MIETERLLLRNFTTADVQDVFEYCSQSGILENGGWPAHQTIEDTQELLSQWIPDKNRFAIVWKVNNCVIGHISIKFDSEEHRSDTRELGFALNKDYHRKGIMSEAIQAVLHDLFFKGIKNIWACCFQNNLSSRLTIEKNGFIFIKNGSYLSHTSHQPIPTYKYRISYDDKRI